MAKKTKAALETDALDVVADHGYFNSDEFLECDEAGITVTLPKTLPLDQTLWRFVRGIPPPAHKA